jgi:septum formation protein
MASKADPLNNLVNNVSLSKAPLNIDRGALVDRSLLLCSTTHRRGEIAPIYPRYARFAGAPLENDVSMTPSAKNPSSSFWLERQPLVLASKSKGRRLALEQTGVPFTIHPAEIDERGVEQEVRRNGGDADAVAIELATRKALVVAAANPGRIVLGADQVMSCEGRSFEKPRDLKVAAEQLRFLSGRSHRLHSAVALVRDQSVLLKTVCCADLDMRKLSSAFIDSYLKQLGDEVLTSVGCYQLEGLGVHLFESICGDHWTILGLPLLPVLDALRREGALLS